MLPYTANDMLYAIKIEYSLDEPSAHALVKSTPDTDRKPRRLRGWMNSLLTVLF
ncbi:MAG: hypothetical protein M3121_02305 [Chloroflexota bacterium]|nr:hypothetical protein [Chloroflexota bacterium]